MHTPNGIHLPDEPDTGLGMGIYKSDASGKLSRVVVPGDAAPGGGKFDFAVGPWVNDKGDMAFTGHVAGEEVRSSNSPPQAFIINALGSLYVKDGASGKIKSIAHAGDPAPGGGVFRQAYGQVINNRGEIVFTGDLTPAPDSNQAAGVFLYSGGVITPVVRLGDPVPGGGHFVTASTVSAGQIHLNNRGDVVFNAMLDTDVNHDGTLDTGLFQWSHGRLSLVARTGTNLPGVGQVQDLVMGVIVTPPPPTLVPNTGAVNNDLGQVLFGAWLTDGRGVLLLSTPAGPSAAAASADALAAAAGGQQTAPAAGNFTGGVFAGAAAPAPIEFAAKSQAVPLSATAPGGNGAQPDPLFVAATANRRALDQVFAGFADELAAFDSDPLR